MATVTVEFDLHFSRAGSEFGTVVRAHSGSSLGNIVAIPVSAVKRTGPLSGPSMHLGIEFPSGAMVRANLNNALDDSCTGWLKYSRGVQNFYYVVTKAAYSNASGTITMDLTLQAINGDVSTVY